MTKQFDQFLYESKKAEGKISLIKLPFALNGLEPVISEKNVDLHYNVHSKNYVKKANADGDEFNTAGAILHNLWWEQLQSPSTSNQPNGQALKLITQHYKTFAQFKAQAKELFMGIHGSGWLVLLTSGKLVTIANHRNIANVALLIDQWEHSYYPTYNADKAKYIDSIWSCINWDIVNARLQLIKK